MKRGGSGCNVSDLLALNDEQFLYMAYQVIMSREPDAAGLNYYLNRLRIGVTKSEILGQLRYSHEGKIKAAEIRGLAFSYFLVRATRAAKKIFKIFISKYLSAKKVVESTSAQSDEKANVIFPADAKSRALPPMIAWITRVNRLFLCTVILPSFFSIIYYGLIASDIFVSESRFVIRSPQRQTSSGIGAILQGVGFSRSQDDTYTVHDFIQSRDALHQLNDKFGLLSLYGGSNIDVLSRFAGLDFDDSFEAFHRYYQKNIISIQLDTASSITTLRVRAFSAEDAFRINQMTLEMSEQLVNNLNERGRQDMVGFAAAEVAAAEKKAEVAALAVSEYRNSKGIFDPERQSALQLQQISKLQDELIATKTQLVLVKKFTPDNPQIAALQSRVETLQSEIYNEMGKVAGSGTSLTKKTAEYERLILEKTFAEKQLAAALASLEQARNDAQRKQLYLERIVQPNHPDIATEPRRLRAVMATLILGFIAWGILTILIAGIQEHRD